MNATHRRTVIRIAELTAANNPKKANREAARKHLVRLVGHDEAERRISDAHLPRLVTT